jgi:hypothetical protein
MHMLKVIALFLATNSFVAAHDVMTESLILALAKKSKTLYWQSDDWKYKLNLDGDTAKTRFVGKNELGNMQDELGKLDSEMVIGVFEFFVEDGNVRIVSSVHDERILRVSEGDKVHATEPKEYDHLDGHSTCRIEEKTVFETLSPEHYQLVNTDRAKCTTVLPLKTFNELMRAKGASK